VPAAPQPAPANTAATPPAFTHEAEVVVVAVEEVDAQAASVANDTCGLPLFAVSVCL
jgi:hypothetical protein